MRILIIDGQGGKMGKQLVETIRTKFPQVEVTAIGTNSIATSNMLKGGAEKAATGENAVIVACRKADIIAGPIGIVIADAMYGEVTPAMAVAVAQSEAVRVLIPYNKCDNVVAGVANVPMSALLDDAILKIQQIINAKTQ